MAEYRVSEDLRLVQDLLGQSRRGVAEGSDISLPTLNRWAAGKVRPGATQLEALYAYAWRRGLRLSGIKAQFHREDVAAAGNTVLFHGAKSSLEGPITYDRSRLNNDLGRGFYCGETFEQAAMFVHAFAGSSVYVISFDARGLEGLRMGVDRDWMLMVALCRGRLSGYAGSPVLDVVRARLESADYVVAPIADNRMYEIIDEFAAGEITDVQCEHALSATDLGMQHVMRTAEAASRVTVLERCYLCVPERDAYRRAGEERARTGRDKARAARRQYRGQGLYVDEVLV